MRIVYTDHLKARLRVRKIAQTLPRQILRTSEEKYWDSATQTAIAIAKVKYRGTLKKLMVVYITEKTAARIITIHPIRQNQIVNRVLSKRWIKIQHE